MKKIMFVCHGNICRSPMAEFIMKDLVKKAGREQEFLIASCATSTEEIWGSVGNPVYPPAKEELRRHGIFCEGKHAVQIRKSDYNRYDLFLCMDNRNIKNALYILGDDPDGKVKRLLSYTSHERDVADPWYSGDFETAYKDIYEGCVALLEVL